MGCNNRDVVDAWAGRSPEYRRSSSGLWTRANRLVSKGGTLVAARVGIHNGGYMVLVLGKNKTHVDFAAVKLVQRVLSDRRTTYTFVGRVHENSDPSPAIVKRNMRYFKFRLHDLLIQLIAPRLTVNGFSDLLPYYRWWKNSADTYALNFDGEPIDHPDFNEYLFRRAPKMYGTLAMRDPDLKIISNI